MRVRPAGRSSPLTLLAGVALASAFAAAVTNCSTFGGEEGADAGPGAEAGGGDGTGPVDGATQDGATQDGASLPDGGDDRDADAAAKCNGKCVDGTVCLLKRCVVNGTPGCGTPIKVGPTGGRFAGEICYDAGAALSMCGQSRPAHVFQLPDDPLFDAAVVTSKNGEPIQTSSPPGACPPNACAGFGANTSTTQPAPSGQTLVVGTQNATGAACARYEILFGTE